MANIVVVVGLLEVTLRVLKPRHHGLRTLLHNSTLQTNYHQVETLPELLDRTVIGYRPGQEVGGYVLNSRGFCTTEYDQEKDTKTYRVVVLGDSFSFGGIPTVQHWTSILQNQLERCMVDRIEVLRLGIPSTGPPFQLRLWQVEGALLGADLVVLGFFVGNDFFDEQGRLPGWRSWAEQLSTVSYAMLAARNLFRMRGYQPPESRQIDGDQPSSSQQTGGFEVPDYADRFNQQKPSISWHRFVRIEAERMSLCLKDEEWKLGFRFDRVARFLKAMDSEITVTGARFVILIIPDEYQVNDTLMRRVARFSGRSEDDFDLTAPQRRLMAFCTDRGIECIDLLPTFRQEDGGRHFYLRRDTHWNRAGHMVAGSELGAHLCQSGDYTEGH